MSRPLFQIQQTVVSSAGAAIRVTCAALIGVDGDPNTFARGVAQGRAIHADTGVRNQWIECGGLAARDAESGRGPRSWGRGVGWIQRSVNVLPELPLQGIGEDEEQAEEEQDVDAQALALELNGLARIG